MPLNSAARRLATLVASLQAAANLPRRSYMYASAAPPPRQPDRPDPDLELVPVLPLPPRDRVRSGDSSSAGEGAGPTVRIETLAGLGGRTPTHGAWDGHAAVITDASPHRPWGGGTIEVLPPLGGCTTRSGDLTRTSANAAENGCDLAVNGSPFSRGGGCIGQSVSGGAKVCGDCPPWDGIPSLGLIPSPEEDGGGGGNGGSDAAAATWVVGTGLTYDVAQSMGVDNAIVGHVPGWLVRSGELVVPDDPGGPAAPRSAVGISRDGRSLIVLVVDGCEHCPSFMGGPRGLTVRGVAEEMVELGAWHAINLDGGGSSTLVHGGRVINFPTAWDVPLGPFWQERAVSTALCVRLGGAAGEENGEEGVA